MPSTTISARIRVLILLGACVALLGIAGCGGGDDSSSSSTTTSSTTEGATGADGADSTDAADNLAGSTDELQAALEAAGVSGDDADCIVNYVTQKGIENGVNGEPDISSDESLQLTQDAYDSCGVDGGP